MNWGKGLSVGRVGSCLRRNDGGGAGMAESVGAAERRHGRSGGARLARRRDRCAGSWRPTPHLTSPLEGGRDELGKGARGWVWVERGFLRRLRLIQVFHRFFTPFAAARVASRIRASQVRWRALARSLSTPPAAAKFIADCPLLAQPAPARASSGELERRIVARGYPSHAFGSRAAALLRSPPDSAVVRAWMRHRFAGSDAGCPLGRSRLRKRKLMCLAVSQLTTRLHRRR